MKLLLFIALLVSVALVRAQETDDIDSSDISEYDELNGGLDESEDADSEISADPIEDPDEDIDDEDKDEDEDEGEIEIEILPTTGYRPTRKRWQGYKVLFF